MTPPVIQPDFTHFKKCFDARQNQIVYACLSADLETPVSLMLKLASAGDNSFLLESVTGGEVRGRYSVVGMKPDLIWKCRGKTAEINRHAQKDPNAYEIIDGNDPLASLRALIKESQIDMPAALPPVAAGLFGYLGYDMVRLVENLPAINPDVIGVPDAILIRPSLVAVLDSVKSEVTIVTPVWSGGAGEVNSDASEAYAEALQNVTRAVQALEGQISTGKKSRFTQPAEGQKTSEPAQGVSNFKKADYLRTVERAKEYIKAGDILQVVPSQRWTQEFTLPPFSFYRSLRQLNPSPFLFFFNFSDFQLIGASPEILVRLRDDEVTIRPIAGTRPRGETPEKDRALEKELLGNEKECAEHLMLLDLGRNDVGRISKIGTVRPTEQFIIERYSHVMHIVSNVVGEIADGEDALSALLAGFPAGTVSGAPKIRAMEIIDELESEKRGIYGGGCGYFAANGDMDMCIALRTGVLKDERLYIQAGGGVVYDSNPEDEYQETVNKSKAFSVAALNAERFAYTSNYE